MRFRSLPVLLLVLPALSSPAPGASVVYRNLVLGDGAVVYYEFDETGGGIARDTVAGNHGVYTGSVNPGAASPAGLGTAADFAGGFVEVPVVGTLTSSTTEAWIQIDSLAAGCCTSIASSGDWATNALHWNLKSDFAGEHAVNNQPFANTLPNTFLADGTSWYHVVVTDEGGITNWFINGVQVIDTGDHTGAGIAFGNSNFQIGAWNGGRLFDGRIDEFAIYDTALSAAQIQAHYNAGLVPEPSVSLLALLGGALALRRRRR